MVDVSSSTLEMYSEYQHHTTLTVNIKNDYIYTYTVFTVNPTAIVFSQVKRSTPDEYHFTCFSDHEDI